jgi:hypothetical protein
LPFTPTQATQEFTEILSRIDLQGRDGHKYSRELAPWTAERFGIPRERVNGTYIPEPKMITARMTQGAARHPRLTYVFLGDGYVPRDLIGGVAEHVGPGSNTEAVAIGGQDENGDWAVTHLLAAPTFPWINELEQAFPELALHELEIPEDEEPAPGPAPPTRRPPTREIPEIELEPRLWRMIRTAIATSTGILLVGPPGTGKTSLMHQIVQDATANPQRYGLSQAPAGADWVTPDESWTTRELVGGETIDENSQLRFRPGHVLNAIRHDRWLCLDEANRADMDKIFSGLLTFLSDHDVKLGTATTAADAPDVWLAWADGPASNGSALDRLGLPDAEIGDEPITVLTGRDWRLLGSYNATDAQRVFRFGQALGRRFIRVPIPPLGAAGFRRALDARAPELPTAAREAIAALYEAHLIGPMILGPAIFLRIADYLLASERVGATADTAEGDGARIADGSALTASFRPVLAEGYLLTAGPWLARLDENRLEDVFAAIAERTASIGEDEWTWIVSMLPSLG